MKSESEYREERNRFVAAAAGKFSFNQKHKLDPTEALLQRAMDITTEIRNFMRPILQAGGWKDEPALRTTIATMYVEAFSHLTKEELENLCTILHLEIMLEDIKSARWGSDQPDLIA